MSDRYDLRGEWAMFVRAVLDPQDAAREEARKDERRPARDDRRARREAKRAPFNPIHGRKE